jgi:hypothetical protein
MSTNTPPSDDQPNNGFFINQGTLSGRFTTPGGEHYTIRKLEPREVTDPRDGSVTTLWGGYAAARDLDRAAKDAQLQTHFNRTGERPADLFVPEAREIPLYVTLRPHAGKGFDHIATFWNSEGKHTVLARDLGGKSNLRFGGNVLPYKSPEELAALREAKAAAPEPTPEIQQAARKGAKTRVTPDAADVAPKAKPDA